MSELTRATLKSDADLFLINPTPFRVNKLDENEMPPRVSKTDSNIVQADKWYIVTNTTYAIKMITLPEPTLLS